MTDTGFENVFVFDGTWFRHIPTHRSLGSLSAGVGWGAGWEFPLVTETSPFFFISPKRTPGNVNFLCSLERC